MEAAQQADIAALHVDFAQSNAAKILRIVARKANKRATRLNVFDFDGTLFDTPGPELGKAAFQRTAGFPWPYEGWWGRPESLQPPLDVPPGPAMEDFRREMLRPDAVTCVVSGRPGNRVKGAVDALLKRTQAEPHFVVLKCSEHDAVTERMLHIVELCSMLPAIREVCVWEDVPDHAARLALLRPGPSVSLQVVLASPDGCRPLSPSDLATAAAMDTGAAGGDARGPELEPALKRRKLAG